MTTWPSTKRPTQMQWYRRCCPPLTPQNVESGEGATPAHSAQESGQ